MADQGDKGADDSPTDLPCLEKPDSPSGSPPTASLSSLMELESCVSNLSLAHEIVMNTDFCLKPRSPPTGSLEGKAIEIVHQAFWDSLREHLNSEPPNYNPAVVLLQDVKSMLQSLLLPGQVRLRSQMDEVLDMELIQQEVDHGVLDLHKRAGYIISTMAALCAPVRDPEVRALRDLKDPVELLREIFRILGLMNTDMVNFTIHNFRPYLLQQAVQYERAKFQQILDKQPASLDNTIAWLKSAASEEASAISARPDSPSIDSQDAVSATTVLHRAYIHLLHWDLQDQKYPETVLMDRARLDALGQQLQVLVLEAAVLLLIQAQCGSAVFSLQGFVGKLRRSVTALLEGSHTRDADLRGALLGLGETAVQQVKEALSGLGGAALPRDNQDLLRGQISDLWKHNNPVRTLIGERVQGFLQAMLQGGPAKRSPELVPALRLVSAELAELGTAFGRIVHFNRTVFGPFYAPILRKLLFPPGEAAAGEDSR
ncbi:T-complex protein 11 homolog [Echeneis naucrates]|uniref:T-complex protein 11 homolog n=1 Tax=Echeneis naucrates TaxID=173247 RepID=UPI001113C25F|nr:T-complex protein 11 homolog [Echeneis naucrates]